MGWSDFYRRRDTLDNVLRDAERDPERPLPDADGFDGPAGLVQAMHYKWMQKLVGYLGVASYELDQDPGLDRVDAISAAWLRAAAENPVLRAVLDRHVGEYADALRPGLDSERRLLALSAGLAYPEEPTEEITRIGAAFMALLDSSPQRAKGQSCPVRHLRRKLPASA
jgi:hypothetical protein